MNTKVLFGMLFVAFLAVAGLTACSDETEEGRKITDYREYMLMVASEKLPGVVTSCGNHALAGVFAVKKERSTEWEALESIGNFDYEEGYEYRIRISATSYLDYRMGDPAWTEYELLEVLSKEPKNSEGLPPHFIPDWYFEKRCPYIDPAFAYAIDADRKEDIENDLTTDVAYIFGGLRYYILFPVADNWFLLDDDMNTVGQGILLMRIKEAAEFPETYKLLPPGQQVLEQGEVDFVTHDAPDDPIQQYDIFVCRQALSKSVPPHHVDIWLYKDLTAYYQNKYPEARVRAVVIRYRMKNSDE